MEPKSSPSIESRGVPVAPFAYGRRHSVFGTRENVADAMAAAQQARRSSSPVKRRDRLHNRRLSQPDGHPLDMAAAVHERARQAAACEQELAVLGNTAGPGLAGLTSSIALDSAAPTLPPLPVPPVPGCLRGLLYTRSARAWDALAAGCVAEAKTLSERDNDIVAWAACFILSGEVQQGMVLLESYAIATCVVVHEVAIGVLGRLPTGINPFARRSNVANKAAREDGANPYLQRKCVERHNQVLMTWMRWRPTFSEFPPLELAEFDVSPTRVTEDAVRRAVLQAMQLVDAVEVQRWYIAALMLYTPADSSTTANAASGQASGGGGATGSDTDGAGRSSPGSKSGPGGFRERQRGQDTDSIFAKSRGGQSTTSSAAGGEAVKQQASASDGYRAPQNLWLRYFFALSDAGAGGDGAANDALNAHVTAAGTDEAPTVSPGAVLTSYEAQAQVKPGAAPAPSQTVEGEPPGPPSLAPSAQMAGVAGDEQRESGRKGSFSFQPGGRLKRTLSWFRERGWSVSQGNRSATPSLNGLSVVQTAPTWHLAATASLDQEQACSLLLSHRAEWDVYFVTAVTAFYTHHYRTCMMSASRFLHLTASSSKHDESGEATEDHVVAGLHRYQSRFAVFLRCWAALQIGERLQAGKDVLTLLELGPDSLSYHVGCALGLCGVPLPEARGAVLAATHSFSNAAPPPPSPPPPSSTNAAAAAAGAGSGPRSLSAAAQAYLYAVTEAVHVTTLLQLGLVKQAMSVAKYAIGQLERGEVTEEDCLPLAALRDALVIAATALEDSRTVLDVSLSPQRLVYVAVCPAFFGGLCESGIRVKAHSATHRTLYPQNLPLYASTRQVIPFHMNRATFLFHSGQVSSAWDDACCAVAAVDEVVGSVEFAFSDCFALRVYHFAVVVGLTLLESLLAADLEAAKACLTNPNDQKAIDEKDAKLQEDELLSKEVVHICQGVVQRMQHFFPHSRTTAICQARLAIVCGGKDYLAQAVALSRRYPDSPPTQNVLTLALYFDHHIPEAVDNARKNLQTFPHSSDVIRVHHLLQEKHVTYNFNYRKLLPTKYKPGSHDRVFTKRMIIVLILLAANLCILCLTAYVNVSTVRDMPDGLRYFALRLQLPTVAPLFFAALFVMHAIVAAVTPKNLISTVLTDLFFVNTTLNRALFCLRCIPLVNLVNAVLISTLGNNFLFESGSAVFVLYFFLGVLFVPFTTRIWFLPSIDEPDVGLMSWLAIVSVDAVVCVFIVVPHVIAAFLEPFMLILFFFFAPVERPSNAKGFQPPSSSIRRRLLLHAHNHKYMPQRFTAGSGSRFIHILALRWLYAWSHCTMETRFLAEAQLEAECYRVFPLFHGEQAEMLFAEVPHGPFCAPMTGAEQFPLPAGAGKGDAGSSKPGAATADGGKAAQLPSRLKGESRRSEAAASATARPSRPPAPATPSVFDAPSSPSHSLSSSLSSRESGSVASTQRSPQELATHHLSSSGSSSSDDDDEFDGTLLAGVRTVDAMRQLLDHTTRERPGRLRHTASFVRPTMMQSFASVFAPAEEAAGTARSPLRGRLSGTLGYSSGLRRAGEGDAAERHRSSALAATGQFPEDIFGRRVDQAYVNPYTAYYASAEMAQRDDGDDAANGALSNADGEVVRGDAAGYGATGSPPLERRPDSDYIYADDYLENNGYGWYNEDIDAAQADGNDGDDDGDEANALDF